MWRQQGLAQDIQECTARALLDINSTLLNISGTLLDIACPILDGQGLLVMLTVFLTLLL